MGYITKKQLTPALEFQTKRARTLGMLDKKKLATALELGFIINSTTSLVEVLSLIMKYACLVTDTMASTLMLRDEKTGELVFSIPTGPKAGQLKDIRIPPGAGIAGWVAENEEHVMVNDTENDTRFYSGIDTMTGGKTKSLLCVPMRSKKRLIGVLEVLNKKEGALFAEEDALLLNIFAHQAAIAIENATLLSSLKEQLEKEKKLKKEYAESERLRAVGALAGGIAHDFNNILSLIMGNTELTLLDCTDSTTKKYQELILEQALRGKNLTRNLMAFARTRELKQKFFGINDKLDYVVDLMKKDLDGIKLVRDYKSGIPELFADPEMIEHTLVNIIRNSIHAMGLTANPCMIIRTYSRDNTICFEIEDNGCGISPEHQDKIYTPSFSLKGSRDVTGSYQGGIKGTGYGMANVKKYIAQHQGTISFESKINLFTRFRVCLPVLEKNLTVEEKKEIVSTTIQPEKRILLVEDEKELSDMQSRILTVEPFCHDVDVAANGKEALELFNKNTYDLISLDYVLPGDINGMDIYQVVRKTDTAVPIVFISGNIEFLESAIKLIQNDSRTDLLSKPCPHRDYVNAINNLLNMDASA